MIVNAKHKCYQALDRTLSDPNVGPKTYWSIHTRLVNNKKTCNIPSLLESGLFITDPAIKANILNEYFVQQCSVIRNISSLPTFLPRINNKLEDVSIQRDKV